MHTLKDLIDELRAASDVTGSNAPLTIGGENEYVVRTDSGTVSISAAKPTPSTNPEVVRLERELALTEKQREECENARQELLDAAGNLLDALDMVDFADDRDYIESARKKLESLL